MRLLLILLLALAASANAGAAPFHYEQPALGRLVFNQELNGEVTAPLRLTKIGQYYAELILEPPEGASDVVLSAPLTLELAVDVTRREHPLLNRSVNVSFAPGERSKTLFWLNVPDHLPNRTALTMHVAVREPSGTQLGNARLRVQLTRKLEFSPLIVR